MSSSWRDRVNANRAALGAPYVQLAGLEVDIVPTQGHELAGSQTVAVGDQDGRGVPMAPAVFPPALISFSISRSVRYSRGRADRLTVTFTAIGACIPGAVFSIVSRNGGLKLLRFFQNCNSTDIGLQTVTEGKERTSTWVKSQVGKFRAPYSLLHRLKDLLRPPPSPEDLRRLGRR